jgi:hypothetical protein
MSPRSRTGGSKKASGTRQAKPRRSKSGGSEGEQQRTAPTRTANPGLNESREATKQGSQGSAVTAAPASSAGTALARSHPAGSSAQKLGAGRRVRTPPPTTSDWPGRAALAQSLAEGTVRTPPPATSDGQPQADSPAQSTEPGRRIGMLSPGTRSVSAPSQAADAPTQALGTGTRIRTALPQPVHAESEEINLGKRPREDRRGRLRGRSQNLISKNSRRARLEAKGAQFRDIQDFLQNPSLVDLRGKQLDTCSTPEEIEARKGEVRYQIQVMRSLVAVLTDELNELEQARPLARQDQRAPTQS